jgi:1-acyl-sn-glycerol-3-phosphate acyltransferase
VSAPAPGEREPLVVEARAVYRLGRGLLVGYLALWHRLRVENFEHLPARGGVLLVANHQSFLDIPVLAVAAPRHVAFVARATLARSRFLAFLMRESGCVLIRPNTPDRSALEAMIAHLEAGDCVAVFPEGTRTRDGSLGTFRAGAVVAARRARVPIVPAAIRGAFEGWPRGRVLPRPARISVRFGAPIPADSEHPLAEARRVIAEMIGDESIGAR